MTDVKDGEDDDGKCKIQVIPLSLYHRDTTRVQMPAKMFPHLKLSCWLFMGPTFGFDTKQRNSLLIKLVLYYNKNKTPTILLIVKYEKIRL